MKILFLNPPDLNKVSENAINEDSTEYIESDDVGTFPPLGLLYVMAYLEKNAPHHKLYFKDCVAERVGHKELNDYVAEIKPDIVAVTSFTVSMVDVVIAARSVRKILPNAHLCLGGHHPIAFRTIDLFLLVYQIQSKFYHLVNRRSIYQCRPIPLLNSSRLLYIFLHRMIHSLVRQ